MVIDLSPTEIDEVEAAIPEIENPTVAGVLRRLVAAGRDEDSPEEFAGIGEAAEAFGVTTQTIRNWVDRGILRGRRLPSGTRQVARESLDNAAAFEARRPRAATMTPGEVEAFLDSTRS